MRNFAHRASTSANVASGAQVTGSVTMPASDRLTTSTAAACSSIGRLRWSTPMPPWRAMAIAIRASVTVSMAAETSGTPSVMFRVSRVPVSTMLGTTSDSMRQQQHVIEGQAEHGELGRNGGGDAVAGHSG